jgi:hypothetical protein
MKKIILTVAEYLILLEVKREVGFNSEIEFKNTDEGKGELSVNFEIIEDMIAPVETYLDYYATENQESDALSLLEKLEIAEEELSEEIGKEVEKNFSFRPFYPGTETEKD